MLWIVFFINCCCVVLYISLSSCSRIVSCPGTHAEVFSSSPPLYLGEGKPLLMWVKERRQLPFVAALPPLSVRDVLNSFYLKRKGRKRRLASDRRLNGHQLMLVYMSSNVKIKSKKLNMQRALRDTHIAKEGTQFIHGVQDDNRTSFRDTFWINDFIVNKQQVIPFCYFWMMMGE